MTFIIKDRIFAYSNSIGASNFILEATKLGYRNWSDIGNANSTYYTIVADNGDWEVGQGIYLAANNELQRVEVYSNSQGHQNKIVFDTGLKEVFCGLPAEEFNRTLKKDLNLSDLTDFAQARANLGFGSAAIADVVQTTGNSKTNVMSQDAVTAELFTIAQDINNIKSYVSVREFGAVGDGVTDDTVAIQSSIDSVWSAGGGVVNLPVGTFRVSASILDETYDNEGSSIPASNGCLTLRSGVYLRGQGAGKSIIKVDSNGGLTAIHAVSPVNGGINRLEIDGSWNGVNGAGHGIFQVQKLGEEWCKNFTIEDVFIHDIASYGIGVQNGDIENLYINRCRIYNSGADGIDIKGRGPGGGDQPAIVITNNYIKKHGRRSGLQAQAGIDWRGFAYVAGNHVDIVEADTADGEVRTGIRSRPAGIGEVYGGAYSRIIGNFVRSDAQGLTRGYELVGQSTVAIGNVAINTYEGYRIAALRVVVASNHAEQCGTAYRTDVTGDEARLTGNSGVSSGIMYLLNASGATIESSVCTTAGTFIQNNGSGNVFNGGRITGGIGERVSGSNPNILISNVTGFRTRYRSWSSTFSLDTAGEKIITAAHNIQGFIPAAHNVVASIYSDTSGAKMYPPVVKTVDETHITFSVYVEVGVGSGTARVLFDVNVHNP